MQSLQLVPIKVQGESGLRYDGPWFTLESTADEQMTPEFLAVSPNNKIPAIVDRRDGANGGDGRAVMESGAILLYLAESENAFWGDDRVETIEWLNPDGDVVEGILYWPVGRRGENGLPLVVDIHGGPWIARTEGATLVPSIVDALPAGGMASILESEERRGRHIDALVAFAEEGGYDGLDLDYEQFAFADGRDTWEATRPNWVAFVEELADRLHEQSA